MNRNLLIPIIILVLVAGGVAVWWSQNQTSDQSSTASQTESIQSSPTPTNQPESTGTGEQASETEADRYTVRLTNDGFEPSTLTVPAGTPVTFVNESEGDMWVASDPHPVHTDYSAFDQRQGGDSYSFTFDEAGAYTYHNHLNESNTGLILVE